MPTPRLPRLGKLIPIAASIGCLLLLAPVASTTPCTQSVLFEAPANHVSGPNPLFFAVADYNEDGLLDLAITNCDVFNEGESSSLAIHLATGPRTYATPVLYTTGSVPHGVVAADFNEDGILDLAVANKYSDNVSVLIGQGSGGVGDGTFATTVQYAVTGGPFQIVTDDFDHDGITDIAVSLNLTNAVAVLRGNGGEGVGDGTFAAPLMYALANRPVGIVNGDFNEDGNSDLIATEYFDGTVAVLLGNGTLDATSFTVSSHVAMGVEPFDLEIADLDEDGDLDLIASNGNHGGIVFRLGNGDGTFGSATSMTTGNTGSVLTHDVNQDGILDLLSGSTAGAMTLWYFPGQGSGGVGNGTFAAGRSYSLGFDPYQLVAGDFDTDGFPDVLATAYLGNTFAFIAGTCADTPPDPRKPVITKVRDVPNDQGGKVFITWTRSSLDVPGGAVNQYTVWRRINPEGPFARTPQREAGDVMVRTQPRPDGTQEDIYWEAAATLPAHRLPGYGYTAATAQDSLDGSNPYSAFFITAATSNVDVFYDSEVDSGYSVDNIPPLAPENLASAPSAEGVVLTWEATIDTDIDEYRVYRGSGANFVPSQSNRIGSTSALEYLDPSASGTHWYKLQALDTHGNEGAPAVAEPLGALAVGDGVPRLALRGAMPNPSRNGRLSIAFSLSTARDARLEIVDLAGRRVVSRTLRSLTPGDHVISLSRGERLAPGVYLVRLQQGAERRQIKAVVTR